MLPSMGIQFYGYCLEDGEAEILEGKIPVHVHQSGKYIGALLDVFDEHGAVFLDEPPEVSTAVHEKVTEQLNLAGKLLAKTLHPRYLLVW